MKKLLILVVIVAILIMGNAIYWSTQWAPVGGNNSIIYELKPGSFRGVAKDLQEQGIIKSAGAFTLYARLMNDTQDIRVGEYELNSNMGPKEILNILTSGKSITYPVTFQEGLNMFEMAEILENQKLAKADRILSLARDSQFVKELLGRELPSLEGYLFPDTYRFSKFTGEKEILKTMVNKFQSVVREIADPRLKDSAALHRILILSSIVEKETGAGFERELVSSVFFNRIRHKMRLQSDPTIIYGARYDKNIDLKNIKRSDIVGFTRFNTYAIDGLPLGPISNPGKAAIVATLNPAKSEYFYFVSFNDGTHQFSKTYADHLKAVKRYQVDPSARKGKSWRDLNKKK